MRFIFFVETEINNRINRKFKITDFFCNILNVFTVTFIDLIHLHNLVIIINLFSHHVFQRVQMMLIVFEFK